MATSGEQQPETRESYLGGVSELLFPHGWDSSHAARRHDSSQGGNALSGADDQRASRRFHDVLGDDREVIDLEDAPDLHE
jgi:hypothetical protein